MKMPKEYPQDKPSKHSSVRLPKEMVGAIEKFLETDLAKSRGFLHKSDVVTAACRELLDKYGFQPSEEEAEAHLTRISERKQ